MRKLIGITSSEENTNDPLEFTLPKAYVQAIENAGGLPIILPIIDGDKELIYEMVEHIDGLLLTGGVDVDPLLFGNEPHPDLGRIDPYRDFFEMHLAEAALKKELPILGICRGCQLLNVAAGGTIVQDIPAEYGKDKVIKHAQVAPRWYATHTVQFNTGSRLAQIFGSEELVINSYHHQSVKEPAAGFQATAFAKDGIIEGIEKDNHRFTIGVQWHPEQMFQRNPVFTKLFKSFVDAC